MTLWTSEQAALATGGKAIDGWHAARVVIDSRSVRADDLFIAIKGERLDGHDYAAEAISKGASAVMVSRAVDGVPQEKQLVVNDTLPALEALGAFARARCKAKIVGVTGSVGKTSAKEMLRLALSAHGETFASHGNFNNHIGTPFNLANLPPSAAFAVFEMGMNHAGEIAALTRQVKPHVAVITNVEPVHLEFFENVDAIADAKAEIFEGLGSGGVAILNRDNAQFAGLAKRAEAKKLRAISCGELDAAEVRLLACRVSREGTEVRAMLGGRTYDYTLAAIGRHWALTSLMALGVAEAWGLDIAKTAAALSGFIEPEGRGRLTPIAVAGGTALLLDDSYNASPASMRAAFQKARDIAVGGNIIRVIAALGEMRELGESAPALHASLAPALAEARFDLVFTAWPLMRHLYDALPETMRGAHAADADALLPIVRSVLRPGDLLLVKGSHGSKMYELAAALQHFGKEKKHAS